MRPWNILGRGAAPDGKELILRQRGGEFLIVADGYDLMSSEDESSSRALADLACASLSATARVLIGGLGMGYTLRAALDALGPKTHVDVAELVPIVATWNRSHLAHLAQRPLDDPRATLHLGDVRDTIRAGQRRYDAILLDVDNGPSALAHRANAALYGDKGILAAYEALRPRGVLGVWSFTDDEAFTRRLHRHGFKAKVHRVPGSRKGRGRYHYIWIAVRA